MADIIFKGDKSVRFFAELNKRVNSYFRENNIPKSGGSQIASKTIIAFLMYLTPYFLILFVPMPLWAMLILVILMGIGTGAIGFNVMHDANHGAFSKKSGWNKWLGYTLNFIGGNAFLWKIQHNYLHHTYTNIHDHDEDLNAGILIRLSDKSPRRKFHKYQHIYGPFLYGLLTISWVLMGDVKRLIRYNKKGFIKRHGSTFSKELAVLIVSKIFYLAYTLLIPYLVLNISFWYILLGFLIMHFTAGFILSMVFQLAHVVEEVEQPHPDEQGNVMNEWAIHQLKTTANFAPKNKILTWYVGGLNFQVEHHLFSSISHIHYPAISNIIRETAQECNVPYYQHPTFFKALASHFKMLKKLGNA